MELGLEGHTAMITGGASGLGKCTAQYLAAEGVRLLIADNEEETLETTAAELEKGGAEVKTHLLDVRDAEACREAVEATVEAFGKLDILINSAGVGGPFNYFVENTPEDWDKLIGVNLLGVINCSHAAAAHMQENNYGKIVSLASEAGKANEKRMVVYGATKGGVISLTRGMALELGRYGINVNAVCPGVTRTPMTAYLDDAMVETASKFYPLQRLGEPEDIAPMIVFLCSQRSSWITGQAISISGGFGRS